jgi:hypothetical protein
MKLSIKLKESLKIEDSLKKGKIIFEEKNLKKNKKIFKRIFNEKIK